ncbi:NAD(P)-binding domain-containing protein [Halalkalibacter oceani]|uniref:NAD(P)-binding domain-containing protein n=1 Tax=Halalkalibacter oceani TaxID=1653776 RepID=UPI003395C86F
MKDKVLVVGAGRMGFGVIQTLIRKGYQVSVSDPSDEAVNRAKHIGAEAIEDSNQSLTDHNVIIMSLPGPVQVKEMTEKMVPFNQAHQPLVIDLSTIDPQTAIDASKRCKRKGLRYIEAPVSGGPSGASLA